MKRRVVCASNVLYGEEAFAHFGQVKVVAPRDISPGVVAAADALVVRSNNRCDAALLEGSRVRFVGTATAGFDHFDTGWFEKAGIAWAHAPGCNASSVAEYVAAALLCLAERHSFSLAGMTLGIVGVGQVGGRVARLAEALGMEVVRNDPPLRAATGDGIYRPLEEVQSRADVLSLHVPLVDGGPYPTRRMVDHRFFSRLRPGCIFINSSRGEVVDPEALSFAMKKGAVGRTVLDVWNDEPLVSGDLLRDVDIGTPHIAGYSLDGKLAGTVAVYREACHFFETEPQWRPPELPPPPRPVVRIDARGRRDEEVLAQAIRSVYDIERDDAALRPAARMAATARGAEFVRLRMEYPPRREFASVRLELHSPGDALARKAAGLGFGAAG